MSVPKLWDICSDTSLPEHIQLLLKSMPACTQNRVSLLSFKKNSTVVKANDPSAYVYFLLSGRMTALAEFSSGINYSFAEFSAYDFIGEMEAITNDPYYAVTVRAQATCQTICLSKEVFLEWMKQSPDASFFICQMVTKKLFSQIKADRSFLFLESIERFILYLIACYQKRSVETTLLLKSTRQQIADKIGFCPKTITRCVKRLAEKGYITIEHNKILITKEQYEQLLLFDSKRDTFH